jgi:hypothetical protein
LAQESYERRAQASAKFGIEQARLEAKRLEIYFRALDLPWHGPCEELCDELWLRFANGESVDGKVRIEIPEDLATTARASIEAHLGRHSELEEEHSEPITEDIEPEPMEQISDEQVDEVEQPAPPEPGSNDPSPLPPDWRDRFATHDSRWRLDRFQMPRPDLPGGLL